MFIFNNLSHNISVYELSNSRCIGCLKLQVSSRKTATNHRALLRKMTYIDKASYASLPPSTRVYSLDVKKHSRKIQTTKIQDRKMFFSKTFKSKWSPRVKAWAWTPRSYDLDIKKLAWGLLCECAYLCVRARVCCVRVQSGCQQRVVRRLLCGLLW